MSGTPTGSAGTGWRGWPALALPGLVLWLLAWLSGVVGDLRLEVAGEARPFVGFGHSYNWSIVYVVYGPVVHLFRRRVWRSVAEAWAAMSELGIATGPGPRSHWSAGGLTRSASVVVILVLVLLFVHLDSWQVVHHPDPCPPYVTCRPDEFDWTIAWGHGVPLTGSYRALLVLAYLAEAALVASVLGIALELVLLLHWLARALDAGRGSPAPAPPSERSALHLLVHDPDARAGLGPLSLVSNTISALVLVAAFALAGHWVQQTGLPLLDLTSDKLADSLAQAGTAPWDFGLLIQWLGVAAGLAATLYLPLKITAARQAIRHQAWSAVVRRGEWAWSRPDPVLAAARARLARVDAMEPWPNGSTAGIAWLLLTCAALGVVYPKLIGGALALALPRALASLSAIVGAARKA